MDTKNITIPAKTFYPYNSYNFTLKGTLLPNIKSNENSVIIIMSDFNQIPLKFNIPEYAIQSKINKNDEILIEIDF